MKDLLVLLAVAVGFVVGYLVFVHARAPSINGKTPTPCPHCQSLNSLEERYCAHCGDLTYERPVCPKCKVRNFIDDKYCAGCAAELPPISSELELKNQLMKQRDSMRAQEETESAREYRARMDQNEALKNEEIQKQKSIREERDRKIRFEEQERKQKEYERLRQEREAVYQKQYQEQLQKQSENSWKFEEKKTHLASEE